MDELDIAIKAVRAYAEMHPRPTQVNQTQAAQMLGISSRTCQLISNLRSEC